MNTQGLPQAQAPMRNSALFAVLVLLGLSSFTLYGKVVTMLPRDAVTMDPAGSGRTLLVTGYHPHHKLAPVEVVSPLDGQP